MKTTRTYTINFEKKRHYNDKDNPKTYTSKESNEIYKMLIEFCNKNLISIKKIVVRKQKDYSCYIKIKGTKKEYDALIDYMIAGDLKEDIDIESYIG